MGVHVSPPPSSSHPSELSQCTGFECPVSCIELELVIYFTYGNMHVSLLFSQTKFFSQIKSIFFCLYHAVLGSITTNNASGGDGIPTELFKILNDDAVKVLQTVLFILRMCPTVWRWFVKILRIFLKKSNGSMEMKSLSKLEVSFRTPLFPMKKHKRIIWPITLITPLALLSAATNLYFSKNYLENVFKWDSGWELGVCG